MLHYELLLTWQHTPNQSKAPQQVQTYLDVAGHTGPHPTKRNSLSRFVYFLYLYVKNLRYQMIDPTDVEQRILQSDWTRAFLSLNCEPEFILIPFCHVYEKQEFPKKKLAFVTFVPHMVKKIGLCHICAAVAQQWVNHYATMQATQV